MCNIPCREILSPGEEVGQELEGDLDVGELVLQRGHPVLHDVLPAVHVAHDLVHRVLRLERGGID